MGIELMRIAFGRAKIGVMYVERAIVVAASHLPSLVLAKALETKV